MSGEPPCREGRVYVDMDGYRKTKTQGYHVLRFTGMPGRRYEEMKYELNWREDRVSVTEEEIWPQMKNFYSMTSPFAADGGRFWVAHRGDGGEKQK